MSDLTGVMLFIKNMLSDLIYINGIIATELIKVTENTATIRRGEEFLQKTIEDLALFYPGVASSQAGCAGAGELRRGNR